MREARNIPTGPVGSRLPDAQEGLDLVVREMLRGLGPRHERPCDWMRGIASDHVQRCRDKRSRLAPIPGEGSNGQSLGFCGFNTAKTGMRGGLLAAMATLNRFAAAALVLLPTAMARPHHPRLHTGRERNAADRVPEQSEDEQKAHGHTFHCVPIRRGGQLQSNDSVFRRANMLCGKGCWGRLARPKRQFLIGYWPVWSATGSNGQLTEAHRASPQYTRSPNEAHGIPRPPLASTGNPSRPC